MLQCSRKLWAEIVEFLLKPNKLVMVNFNILHSTFRNSELLKYCCSACVPLFCYLVSVVGHLNHKHVFILNNLTKFTILVLQPCVYFILVVSQERLDFTGVRIKISWQIEVCLVALILYFENCLLFRFIQSLLFRQFFDSNIKLIG